jgi:cation:H+ antiporter
MGQFLWLILGLVILIKGADWLIIGASALARRYHISDLAIGLTVVAFGTSAPELVVNVFSSLKGFQALAVSNILGSNLFNLFMILGLAGMISPLVVQSSTVWKEIPLSLLALLAFLILANTPFFSGDTGLSRLDGFILLLFSPCFCIMCSGN